MSPSLPSLIPLLWLSSPALPIGSYGYSRALEQAVTRGVVHDEASLHGWLDGVLRHQLATLDAPILARVYWAAQSGDLAQAHSYCELLAACRETRELSLEDVQLGGSLLRLLRDLRVVDIDGLGPKPGHAAVYGLACARLGVAVDQAISAYLFAFVENQVTCALKCMLLGQTVGQRVLLKLMATIPALVTHVLALDDTEIGSYAPGLSMLSALHETQYSRLFRS